jgi:hypothetical protein
MTWTPIIFLAVHLDMASETNAPPKPIRAPKTSSEVKSMPCAFSQGSKPSSLSVTLATKRIAKLVTRNSRMRFMDSSLAGLQRSHQTIGRVPGSAVHPGGGAGR